MTISIISFAAGTTIRSADMNSNFTALTNALSGATANNFIFLATSNASIPLTLNEPSLPTAVQDVLAAQVTGDTVGRISLGVRGTDTDSYGVLRGGVGASYTATLYAQASGWQTDQAFHINQTIGAGNKLMLQFVTTDKKTIGLAYNFNTNSMYFYNYTDSKYMQEFNANNGSMYIGTGTASAGNYFPQLASNGGGAAGQKIWVGTTDPAGNSVEGDLWLNG